MAESLKELVQQYRKTEEVWRNLLEKESDKRDDLISKSDADEGDEPANLREVLDDYADKSGLRDKQRDALIELKEAERKLFAWQLDHTEDPQMREELGHLAQDYAGRITWLRQLLKEK